MDCICAGHKCCTDDILHIQITFCGWSRTYTDCFICELGMQRIFICLRVNSNCFNSHFPACPDDADCNLALPHVLLLAVATSIDAFAVGVSFAFMNLNIGLSVAIIGVTTGLFAAAGLCIGRLFGSHWQKPAQIAGGIVLILIGVKVLFEHLGFLG